LAQHTRSQLLPAIRPLSLLDHRILHSLPATRHLFLSVYRLRSLLATRLISPLA
jgi:hypothetical protein